MTAKKIILLALTVSLLTMSLTASATAAARKASTTAVSTTPNANFVGIVDMGLILDSHPDLNQARQKYIEIARQKENEATAAANRETDQTKKAQAVQAKRMELAQEEQKIMAPIYRDCQQAVREVAVKRKLTLVMTNAVVLIGGVDITQDVIQQLSRKK